jgi:hypothetical protein
MNAKIQFVMDGVALLGAGLYPKEGEFSNSFTKVDEDIPGRIEKKSTWGCCGSPY